MASLDNLVVTTALPSIRAGPRRRAVGLEWTVNAYTLTFAVLLMFGAALGDRFGRRRLFLVGLRIFTARVRRGRPRLRHRRADRRPRGPGRRRGDHDAADPDPAHRRRAGRPPRRGLRDLGRGHRTGGRQRPADRRQPHRAHLLAVDLLAQRPDRPRSAPARPAAAAESRGPAPGSTSPARAGQPRPVRHRLRAWSAATADGWTSALRARRPDRRRACCWRRSSAYELRAEQPDAADAAVPQPRRSPRSTRRAC